MRIRGCLGQLLRFAGVVSIVFSLIATLFWVSSTDYTTANAERWLGTGLPAYATDTRGFSFSLLQGRTAYLRVDIPAQEWEDFIEAICITDSNDVNAYGEADYFYGRFTSRPQFIPGWWQPEDAVNYEVGYCGALNYVSGVTLLTDKDDASTYRLYLIIGPI